MSCPKMASATEMSCSFGAVWEQFVFYYLEESVIAGASYHLLDVVG
jgi:hypothetical protein